MARSSPGVQDCGGAIPYRSQSQVKSQSSIWPQIAKNGAVYCEAIVLHCQALGLGHFRASLQLLAELAKVLASFFKIGILIEASAGWR